MHTQINVYIYIYIIHLFSYFLMLTNYAAAAPLGGVSALKPWNPRDVTFGKVW